jgi:hypothetical protein
MKLFLKPGDILLTSGVGGPAAQWKDRLLSKAIIANENIQEVGFRPSRSHAELITTPMGETFAARWRTRKRENGFSDYIGSEITIGRIVPEITSARFWMAWNKSKLSLFDGDLYPVHRILMQGLGTWFFRPMIKWGIGHHAICSELVACFCNGLGMAQFEAGWRGWTPAMLERFVRFDDMCEMTFDGVLTEEIMKDSGLPILGPD